MEIADLVNAIDRACGLNEVWAKTCIYYGHATYHLRNIDWMPILLNQGLPGSGKTELQKILKQISYKPTIESINCEGITYATLRDELAKAKYGTAFIEEADLHPNRKQLEGLLHARVDKKGTSTLRVKDKMTDGTYKQLRKSIFGATVVHDRHGFNSLATIRRTITVELHRDASRTYVKDQKVSLSPIRLGKIPDIFDMPETQGSALDTWSPLIRVADSLSDTDWFIWVWDRVREDNKALSDGTEFELESCLLGAVISGYCEISSISSTRVLDKSKIKDEPLALSKVTDLVRKTYNWISPKTVATKLRKMGFGDIHNKGGTSHIFTTYEEIKNIADNIGYQDELL